MKKVLALALVGFLAAGFAAAAAPAGAAEYDRYERRTAPPPPPPPPAAYRTAPAPVRHAAHGQTYFFANAGIFDPNGTEEGLSGFDSGWNLEGGIGSRVSPFISVDGTIGMYGADRGNGNDVTVVPFTVGVRFILPHPIIEPYFGFGLGIYLSEFQNDIVVFPGGIADRIDDNSTDIGGYTSLGVDFWMNPRMALNLQAKYHWVEPTLSTAGGRSFDADLGGWNLTVGFRVGF